MQAHAVARDVLGIRHALPTEAVKLSRRLLRGEPDNITKRINDEAALFAERLRSPEALAAFNAFLSRKR